MEQEKVKEQKQQKEKDLKVLLELADQLKLKQL